MVGTMSVVLSGCTLPGQVNFYCLGPGKMKFGRGMHVEAVLRNSRRAEHLLHVTRRLVQYIRGRLNNENVEKGSLVSFVASLNSHVGLDQKTLKVCYDRLHSLMLTLEITDTDEFLHIQIICDVATLVGTYGRGFSIIIEQPFDERMPHIPDPILQISCHDALLATKPVFDRFQYVEISSGTFSPIDLCPSLLNFHPVTSHSFTMPLTRDCIWPVVLTRGSDQLPVSTKFDMRSDHGVVRKYVKLLLEMVSIVPDGIGLGFWKRCSFFYVNRERFSIKANRASGNIWSNHLKKTMVKFDQGPVFKEGYHGKFPLILEDKDLFEGSIVRDLK